MTKAITPRSSDYLRRGVCAFSRSIEPETRDTNCVHLVSGRHLLLAHLRRAGCPTAPKTSPRSCTRSISGTGPAKGSPGSGIRLDSALGLRLVEGRGILLQIG